MSLFTQMGILTSQGNLLTLQLADDLSGYTLQPVGGLDPVKATLASSSSASRRGATYQGASLPPRNITMTVGLDPYPETNTVRGLRQNLYNFFAPESQITMTFYDDEADNVYQIVGIVESCESDRFSQNNDVAISVMCYDPDFTDPDIVTITGMTTADVSATDVGYVGTAPTGLVFTVAVNRSLSEFSIYYVDPNSITWTLDFATTMLDGDVITISTVTGNKYATLLRAGTPSSIVFAISPQSTWPQLSPGSNSLRVSADGDPIPVNVSYTTRFGAF